MPDHLEPSPGQRARYYLFDKKIPGHELWTTKDIESSFWPWRNGIRDGLFIFLGSLIGAAVTGHETAIHAALLVLPIILVMRFLGRRRAREIALRKHRAT